MWRECAAATAPGLVAATVAALPVVLAAGEGCCAVCLGAYGAAEMVKLIPVCRHKFHPGCIDTWLLSRGSCPVCRCSELGGAGEIRVDVFGSKWETEEKDDGGEEEEEIGPSRKFRRSRSSSRVEMEGIGKAMVFLRHRHIPVKSFWKRSWSVTFPKDFGVPVSGTVRKFEEVDVVGHLPRRLSSFSPSGNTG
ncbi:RING-H2 finger protein ATL67 [Platanthera guangdongensis]|uniref:RING-type E3 ubiquitin transferase n=1 Tax=Platanthera guangdongensis TaxID=2320717 RepID=A0ABR2LNL1_9ASPA